MSRKEGGSIREFSSESREWTPGNLLKVSGSFWEGFTLHAGVLLDIFSIIGDHKLSCEDVARCLSARGRGVEMLLNALSAMGLLIKERNLFANSPASRRHLCSDSQEYYGDIIKHHHHIVDGWSKLHESVLSGQPAVSRRNRERGEDELEAFLMGMFNLAMGLAPILVPAVNLEGRKKLLDLGGGPGTYAIQFCKANPDLSAVVFDRPSTRSFAEKTIAGFGMSERISFKEGNFLEDNLPVGFDVAWLSHVLHGDGPEDCQLMLKKTASSLCEGGLLLIHEFILDNTMDRPLQPALFSLNMLVGTERGQAYSEAQLAEMMRNCGFTQIKSLPLAGPAKTGIMSGLKE